MRFTTFFLSIQFAISLACGVTPAGAADAPQGGHDDGVLRVLQELNAIYRTQGEDGSLEFKGSRAFFETYPLLATFALDANRTHPDPAFVSHSAAAAARYYGYLFTRRDRNANLLIEAPIVGPDGKPFESAEDPGFNALLAIDMLSLARLNLELRKPFEALYWYEGARSVQRRVVEMCFDIDASYFFPVDTRSGNQIRSYFALSALPLAFEGLVGDNHAAGLINHYLLKSHMVLPEAPCSFVLSPDSSMDVGNGPDAGRLLKAALLAATLEARGFPAEAESTAARALRSFTAAGTPVGTSVKPPAQYDRLVSLLRERQYEMLLDRTVAVDIFAALVRLKRKIDDNEIVRLESSVKVVEQFARDTQHARRTSGAAPEKADVTRAETSIRNVFWTASTTSEQVSKGGFFDRQDSYAMSGLELGQATVRMLDDVVTWLRAVENDVNGAVARSAGIGIKATLMNERTVAGQKVEIRWVIDARTRTPVTIRSAQVIRGQEIDTLVRAGDDFVVEPGRPISFSAFFTARDRRVHTLIPWIFKLTVMDGSGRKIQHNAFRTAYIEQQVEIVAVFPEGKVLQGLSVPIEIRMVKKTPSPVKIEGGWYSPSGLQLKEGQRFDRTIENERDTSVVAMNVLVPSPCRPGSFPFKMKFLGNGKDLGTISSSFFKPYQWLFIGPFEGEKHALTTPYPPEGGVDLRKVYTGAKGRIAWQVLPDRTNADYGDVLLWEFLNPAGVAYLYTVIESSLEKSCPLYLAANTPVAVFVNEERVLEHDENTPRDMLRTTIRIREGLNNILLKVVGDQTARLHFKLGDDVDLASDEFNNNLWELIGGYAEFEERSRALTDDSEDVRRLVTLRYRDSDAHSVSVIGTFNGWSPDHSLMRKAEGGAWEITLSLRPGKHAYRFLVNNREQVLDPNSHYEEPDGYGGKNSVIFVSR